jgi:hypothetical protein
MFKKFKYSWRQFLEYIAAKTKTVFGEGDITYHRINDLDQHSVENPRKSD